jgi:hypothetical protein
MSNAVTLLQALIREMAWTGDMGDVVDRRTSQPSPGEKDPLPGLRKYFGSKKYEAAARYAFRNFDTEIWLVPALGEAGAGPRVRELSFAAARHLIIDSGIGLSIEEKKNGVVPGPDNEKLRESRAKEHLANSGGIIIQSIKSLQKNFWPSPWNTLHAIVDDIKSFESTPLHRKILTEFNDVVFDWERETRISLRGIAQKFTTDKGYDQLDQDTLFEQGIDTDPSTLYRAFRQFRVDSMTMGSARNSAIPADAAIDVHAEALVQSFTHEDQFHLKGGDLTSGALSAMERHLFPANQQIAQALIENIETYAKLINGLRDNALKTTDEMMSGKIIQITVVDI